MVTPLLAKPSGITLRDHRQHVHDEAVRLLDAWPTLDVRYTETCGTSLRQRVREAAWWHDVGKEHSEWQTACRQDYDVYRAWRSRRGLDPDALSAADYARFEQEARRDARATARAKREGRPPPPNPVQTGTALLRAHLRHEFASLTCPQTRRLSLPVRAAIAAHHGHLRRHPRSTRRWKEDGGGTFWPLWEAFVRDAAEGDPRWTSRLLARYETAGVRALLRLADTRASAVEAGHPVPDPSAFGYMFRPEWTRRPVQQAVEACFDAPVSILRAPTGSGKTVAALLWGQAQVDAGRADRLVIAMPTRFTSNALALVSLKDLAGTGLYHSSAWHARFASAPDAHQALAREHHKMAQLLATPATVCTIDHLMLALTGAREDHYATFFFLANSAVVFDEVDFYDPFVQANLVVLLDALRALKVPVLLMSATVPESARETYRIVPPIVKSPVEEGGARTLRLHPVPAEVSRDGVLAPGVEDVLRRMVDAGTGIVYANTVARAAAYFTWLKAANAHVVLYHSQFTEPDKKAREDEVIAMLGEQAWQDGRARGIVVFTQIGEMSVNVSAPLLLSDACPWDRLAQRLGRLNRFREAVEGEAWVVLPHRNGHLYPAPYGRFDRAAKTWTARQAFTETCAELLSDFAAAPDRSARAVSASDLVERVNRLYPSHVPFPVDASANAARLQDMVLRNWLLAQAQTDDEDTGDVGGDWSSRDIEPHVEIATVHPLFEADDDVFDEEGDEETRAFAFRDFGHLRGFLLEHAVSLPIYLLEQGLKSGEISRFAYRVGESDRETRAMYWTTGYSKQVGMARLSCPGLPDDAPSNIVV